MTNFCSSTRGVYIVLYADDILLLSPTVCELQNVLHMCKRELDALDLTINVNKTRCLRIDTHVIMYVSLCILCLVYLCYG